MAKGRYYEQTTLEKLVDFLKYKEIRFRYNELKDVYEVEKSNGDWMHIDDRKVNDLLLLLADSTTDLKKEIKSTQKLRIYIENSFVAPTYNPLRRYFDGLEFDGHDHVKDLTECLIMPPKKVELPNGIVDLRDEIEKFFRIWLRTCVASVYKERGNQVMLLLVGIQGIYKTTFLNSLIPTSLKDNLFCGHISPSLKENFTCDLLAEKFIINIDDQVEELLNQKFQEIKSVITSDYVSNRKVYRKDAIRRKRIANFVGSANSRSLFADLENRRYLTVEVTQIRIDELKKINIDQVWAQSLNELRAGKQYIFGKEDIEVFNEINAEFSANSVEQEFLPILFQPCDKDDPKVCFMQMGEILRVIRKVTNTNVTLPKLSGAWKKLKYPDKISKRIKGVPNPLYVYPVIKNYTEEEGFIEYNKNNIYS